MKFRKKPVVIEAIQFDGKFWKPVVDFCGPENVVIVGMANDVFIRTLEGPLGASPGDWIIKGVNGEFYPCKPDIFAKTYEPVEE